MESLYGKTGGASDTGDFAGAFEAEVTIKGGDAAMTAVLGRDENGAVTLTVKEPSPLAGVVLKQKDGQMTASYGNMRCRFLYRDFRLARRLNRCFRCYPALRK